METTILVNVRSCTLETTVNMDAHHHVTTTMLLIMFHLNVAIVFALLHVLVVTLQTSLEKLFVSVLAEIVNGIQTELHIPKQFNVQHRRHPFLLLRRKKRQQLQRQAQRLQQHQQQLRQQQHRDVNINKKPQRNRDQSMQQRQLLQRERLPPQEKLQPQLQQQPQLRQQQHRRQQHRQQPRRKLQQKHLQRRGGRRHQRKVREVGTISVHIQPTNWTRQ